MVAGVEEGQEEGSGVDTGVGMLDGGGRSREQAETDFVRGGG